MMGIEIIGRPPLAQRSDDMKAAKAFACCALRSSVGMRAFGPCAERPFSHRARGLRAYFAPTLRGRARSACPSSRRHEAVARENIPRVVITHPQAPSSAEPTEVATQCECQKPQARGLSLSRGA